MKLLYLILLLLPLFNAQVYYRIPKNTVNEFVINFLNYHTLNNCFQHKTSSNQLFLKCWINNKLHTVNIEIDNYKIEIDNYKIEDEYNYLSVVI